MNGLHSPAVGRPTRLARPSLWIGTGEFPATALPATHILNQRRNPMISRMARQILVTGLLLSPLAALAESNDGFPFRGATLAQLQAETAAGPLTSVPLTRAYNNPTPALYASRPCPN